ncbi:MAG: radical SAM protein, partial [Pseudomonadota bacterium]
NIELPTEKGLKAYAPEKTGQTIRKAMGDVKQGIVAQKEARRGRLLKKAAIPKFAPGGQSTQMIVGADQANDIDIITTSTKLYKGYQLRRVYYSAYSPIPDASSDLPPIRPPLLREHRLYQADWMYRFYGFSPMEIGASTSKGMLDLDIDPKLSWALKHREWFPVDVNKADRTQLLRVPGLGPLSVKRILSARRVTTLRLQDIGKMTLSLKKILPFIETLDWSPGGLTDMENLRARFTPAPQQMSLFA